MCGGGGGERGECEEDQNSSISFHVSEMFKLLGAFTPEMPITLSFLDSVLYEIQNKETKKKKKEEREREKKKYTFGHLSNERIFSIDWLVGTVNIEWSIQSIKQLDDFILK